MAFLREWSQSPEPARFWLIRGEKYCAAADVFHADGDLYTPGSGWVFTVYHAVGGESGDVVIWGVCLGLNLWYL